MNNKDIFKEYYGNEKDSLIKYINRFNEDFIKEDNSIIRDYFEMFSDLNSEGKLIRGILVSLGYNILKEDKEYSYPLSLAYEVLQTAVLIHDDFIDRDDKRRGKATVHYRNNIKYKDYLNDTLELNHFSNSVAVCMGDYGVYEANRIIVDNYINDKRLGIVLSYFDKIVLDTIKGELLDVVIPINVRYKDNSVEDLEEQIINIYRLKTSYYTIVGPLACGLLLAGADNKMIDDIKIFGEKIGIAFQIQDDILGIYSDKMGKKIGSDIEEFKQTIMYSYIIKTEYKDEFMNIYGKEDITKEEILKVRELFKNSGALDYASLMMNNLYDEGLKYLDNIKWINDEWKNILKGFVESLRERIK